MHRNIIISKPSKVSYKDNQLIIAQEEKYSVPIEDIGSLVLEDSRSSITITALSNLSQAGSVVYVCDEKHVPTAVVLPFAPYYRRLKIIRTQFAQGKPFLKQLWRQIVVRKILNQALCLKYLQIPAYENLDNLAKTVRSGDTQNIEGVAANIYFRSLFAGEFNRGDDNAINAALNYGYAILRGAIARYLAIYGFEPCIGIFHCSELNNFNLADDLIEPFRPIVDLFVLRNLDLQTEELPQKIKYELVGLLMVSVISNKEKHSVHYAMEKMVQSLSACYQGKSDELILPELIPLKVHEYE